MRNLILLAMGLFVATGVSRAEDVIVKFDMNSLNYWNLYNSETRRLYFDQTQLVTSLQGLANRESARLYIRYNASLDDFWWARMTENNAWLNGRTIENASSIPDLLSRFSDVYNGVVVWDERVPATANLATTIAGSDNLLAIRYDTTSGSLYDQLVINGPHLSVVIRLLNEDGSAMFTGQGTIPDTELNSTGSAKCDAYLWLVEHYLKTGKLDPKRMGYFIDSYWMQCWTSAGRTNHTLNNQDFVIARKGFIFDLNVWDDEACVDDPNQAPGTDAQTLRKILRAAYEQFNGDGFIHVAGFVPWAFKYTSWAAASGTHEPVPTEWRYAEILSCFNAFMDADAIGLANMTNASFFQHYPLATIYPQPNKPTRESLIAKGVLDADGLIIPRRYVAHYVGDYDAAAWLYQKLPSIWNDANRGAEPLSWAFNPNLCERFPLGMAWTRETATNNDTFVSGDCGAGYINPGHLVEPRLFSNLPSGVAAWEAHCQKFFTQWDISLVGFVIDGNAPCMNQELFDSYARFAPDGIVPTKVPLQGIHDDMPFTRMRYDMPSNINDAANIIDTFMTRQMPQFDVFRSILKTPTWYKQLGDELRSRHGNEIMVVDLYTLMWLVREYEQHPEIYLWPYSPYTGAAEITTTPAQSEGITPLDLFDGPITAVTHEGRSAWRVASGQYFCMDVDDAFPRRNGQPVYIEIEYYDEGLGAFMVQYDSTDASAPLCGYYTNTPSLGRADSRQWKTFAWHLPYARFGNSQNGQADLRIWNGNGDSHISRIRIFYKDIGQLHVTIEPSDAIQDGAQWRLTTGSDTGWHDSGQTLTNIPAGTYALVFTEHKDWQAPADIAVDIVNNTTTTMTGTYLRLHRGDLDNDKDVDQTDFGLFQACYSGNGVTQPAPECERACIDSDDDVDQNDFAIFLSCMSGAGVESDPVCN